MELAKYISTHSESTENTSARQRELGFTISYPVDQAASSSGTAVKWKSLAVDDTVEFDSHSINVYIQLEKNSYIRDFQL